MESKAREFQIHALVAAAHELKAPLVLIRQLSLQLTETDDTVQRQEIARRIRLTSERSLRLVSGLSKTARLQDSLFDLAPISIKGVVTSVVDEVQPLSDALGQKIEIKSRRDLIAVGHFDLIRTILLGLIDNSLMSGDLKHKIEVRYAARRQDLVLSVRDMGPIIDKTVYESLVENLGTGGIGLADRPLSSGLGLFIASQFATYMRGGLSVVRHRRGGMTFNVRLPLSHQMELF